VRARLARQHETERHNVGCEEKRAVAEVARFGGHGVTFDPKSAPNRNLEVKTEKRKGLR
jgi:hypothetical protein